MKWIKKTVETDLLFLFLWSASNFTEVYTVESGFLYLLGKRTLVRKIGIYFENSKVTSTESNS